MKLKVHDIECLKGLFLNCFYDVTTKQWVEFQLSAYKNDLDAMVKFLSTSGEIDYLVGFNSLNYDSQVVEYIVRNNHKWYDLSNQKILAKIFKQSQETISRSNHGMYNIFPEHELCQKQIDLFKIHHFDNENRRCSLKWLEFMMDMENVEEMPYHHTKEHFTPEEIQEVIDYCRNDVLATYQFYLYTIGEVEHEQYKGKNKIQDRLDIITEGLLPEKAINYSDSKIGDEVNKLTYCKLANLTPKQLYEKRKGRGLTKKFTYGDAIPEYVKFQTKELQDYYESIKKEKVSLLDTDKQEYPITFRGTTYSIMRGGIHSTEKNRKIVVQPDEILEDADVGAQYPNAIKKRNLYPKHLGPTWNKVGAENIVKKDFNKQQQKQEGLTDRQKGKFKSLEGLYKIALNAGYFGKTNERTNWQYGPEVAYYCTIGNQFEILMLIEMLELAGIHCVSANTDGIVCLFKQDQEATYKKVCLEWEKIVGNDVQGKLEYTEFAMLAQESINHYVAVKKNGSVKIKGRFVVECELNKNNTDKISRIERKALVDYFTKNTPIEKTIKECDNLFMFGIGKKASREYHYETLDISDYKKEVHKKLIRFYVSTDGVKLLKVKNEDSDAPGAPITRIFGEKLVTIFNRYQKKEMKDYNIDYQFYIDNITTIVKKIERNSKSKSKPVYNNPNQIKLF